MTVKQISVFLENKPGKLAAFTKILSENDINMRALSLAETSDFGILRLIVDDTYKTSTLLKDEGFVFSITKVLAVAIPDKPGSLNAAIEVLGNAQINIEYMYAVTTHAKGLAYMIFRVADNAAAIDAFTKNGIKVICQDEFE